MTQARPLYIASVLFIGATTGPVLAAQDVRVETTVSQTALWVGSVVTYRVTLTCRPGVDVLAEDLAADKLPLQGLQVVNQNVTRDVTRDGTTRYVVDFGLTTFEPGAETVSVGDWTVRYAATSTGRGGSAPAQELQVPGAALAWRSALPDEPATLDLRGGRAVPVAPAWFSSARLAGFGLIAASVSTFAWLMVTRLTAGRPRKAKRRVNPGAARDLREALVALRDSDVATASVRLTAYASVEAALRRHAAEVSSIPAAALTPVELRERLVGVPFSSDELSRILSECERVRYQPIDRLPDAAAFRSTAEAAASMFADS